MLILTIVVVTTAITVMFYAFTKMTIRKSRF
jgi:hypothetical protein